MAEVALFDGNTFAPLPPPDMGGIDDDLHNVAWSIDGETLFAAGLFPENSVKQVVIFEAGGAGSRRLLPVGKNTVMSLRPLPDGALLVATADPWLGVVAADGTPRWTQAPKQIDLRGQRHNLAVSPTACWSSSARKNGGRGPATLRRGGAEAAAAGRRRPRRAAGAGQPRRRRLGEQHSPPPSTARRCRSSATRSPAAWRSIPTATASCSAPSGGCAPSTRPAPRSGSARCPAPSGR